MKNYDRRLARLESIPAQQWRDVRCMICQGCFYDELTDEQQKRYCEYIGTTPDVFEECNLAAAGTLHLQLESKPETPTPSKLREIIGAIENTIFNVRKELKK